MTHRPLTHDKCAYRRMGDLGDNIQVVFTSIQGVQVVLEALPVPRQTFSQHDLRNILDPLHQFDQHIAIIRLAGCEPHTAITDHGCRYPVPG